MTLKGNPDKLPKWAQEEMTNLQRQAAELRRDNDRLRAALAGNGGSRFSTGHGHGDGITLPSNTDRVAWAGRSDGAGFDLQLVDHGDHLEVRCSSWQGVSITPQASNVIHVKPGRDR